MIESLRINGTNISYCRSQTYDSAGNMAGKQNGAALNFKKKKKKKKTQNDRGLYYHCAYHKFNLALAKASRVPEIFDTVCLFQSLGRFFASSAKRQRLFEKVIQEKIDQSTFNKMKKKIKPFCQIKWVERHRAFEDLDVSYFYFVLYLEKISKNEDQNWDPKSVVESSSLLRQLIESKFFVAFQVCRYLLGFTKSISITRFRYRNMMHI